MPTCRSELDLAELRSCSRCLIERLGTALLRDSRNDHVRTLVCTPRGPENLHEQLRWVLMRVLTLLAAHARGLIGRKTPESQTDDVCSQLAAIVQQLAPGPNEGVWNGLTDAFELLAADADGPGHPGCGLHLFARRSSPAQPEWWGQSVALRDDCLSYCLCALNAGFDWRAIDGRALGAVHEHQHALRAEVRNPGGRGAIEFVLEPVSRGSRTLKGSFYTPDALVGHLLDQALEPTVAEALSRVRTNSETRRSRTPREALLQLRVCDPACGTGNFLVPAARRLSEHIMRVSAASDCPKVDDRRKAFEQVLRSCIYGVDIDPLAVELCKAALWFELDAPGTSVAFLDAHIRCGDAIVGATPELVARGVPDAAFEARKGDDRSLLASIRKRNRLERSGRMRSGCEGLDGDLSRCVRRHKRAADAWCAAFFVRPGETAGSAPADDAFVTQAVLDWYVEGDLATDARTHRRIETIARERRFFHWAIEFPQVCGPDGAAGFDVIIGNPPFLGQLDSRTVTARARAAIIRLRSGDVVRRYVDEAAAFLLVGSKLVRPGGRIALVQPQSVLAASDAIPVRRALVKAGSLESLWVSNERMFADAAVYACAAVICLNGARRAQVKRFAGSSFCELPSIEVEMDALAESSSWAELAGEASGAPDPGVVGAGRLADIADATADFRDQYYGLAGFVVEDAAVDAGARIGDFPPIVTSGLIDLARCWWGARATRLHKRRWTAPRVDRHRLVREGTLGAWVDMRLVPKVLVATQTRVIEVFVDERGEMLPSVPVVTLMPHDPGMLWMVAAAACSPVSTAAARRRFAGAALSSDAIKLSARQVLTLPLPRDERAWSKSAEALRAAQQADGMAERDEALREFGIWSCESYGLGPDSATLTWWLVRAGLCDEGI